MERIKMRNKNRALVIANRAIVIVALILIEAFAGFRWGHSRQQEQDTADIIRNVQANPATVQGSIYQITPIRGKNNASIGYKANYRFLSMNRLLYAGEATTTSNVFRIGQSLRINYSCKDPSYNYAVGYEVPQTPLILRFGIIAYLLLPLLVLYAPRKGLSFSNSQRISIIATLILAGVIGYFTYPAYFRHYFGDKLYTFQVERSYVGNGAVFYNDNPRAQWHYTLNPKHFIVNGKTYPVPPNRAHVWLNNGKVLVNGKPEP